MAQRGAVTRSRRRQRAVLDRRLTPELWLLSVVPFLDRFE